MRDNGRYGPPSPSAAGLKALAVTLEYAQKNTGIVRALHVLSSANQKSGFDCPGCAWPDPESRTLAEFCENGAKAILDESTRKRVTAEFFAQHSIEDLKGKSERWLNEQGRITEPMILRPGKAHYEPLSYSAAFSVISRALLSFAPEQVAFYTSGRASNEAAFLLSLLTRKYGTNNLPDCSNLCHESSGVALKESLGIGKGTVRLSDFTKAGLIFVIGQNPGSNHPRMLTSLRDAKRNGATIVSINPLIETGLRKFAHPQEPAALLQGGEDISDQFVRVRVNGDQALFRGINKALLALEPNCPTCIDRTFIKKYTEGIDGVEEKIRATPWEQITKESGVPQEEIEGLARLSSQSKGTICCWAMGLTQHQNAVAAIQEVTNYLLLTGNMGRAGAGACPVRGHSNVQGDRTMGIACTLPEPYVKNLDSELKIKAPTTPGLDTVATILAMANKKIRALLSLGGNFLSASPDTEFTEIALAECDLTVQISTKLNRSHLITGKTAIILPCLGRTEIDQTSQGKQFVTVENSMGIVHSSQGNLKPAHRDLKGEPTIIAELGAALFLSDSEAGALPWNALAQNYDAVRDLIERVVPGFDSFNKRVRQPGGFELPNGPRQRHFTTVSGKAQFIRSSLSRIEVEKGELLLMTVRSHDQFNTTVYTDNDRYRGVHGTRKVLLMNARDLKARGLASGDPLTVTSHHTASDGQKDKRTLHGLVALSYDVPAGSAVAYFPEANPLIFLESFAARSRTPSSKSIRITVSRESK